MALKVLYSTGDAKRDSQILAEAKGEDRLRNTVSLEEAQKREREANKETATGESHNALTENPKIEGQVLAIVSADDKEPRKEELKSEEVDVFESLPKTKELGKL